MTIFLNFLIHSMFMTVLYPKSLAQMLTILNLNTIVLLKTHVWETFGNQLFFLESKV